MVNIFRNDTFFVIHSPPMIGNTKDARHKCVTYILILTDPRSTRSPCVNIDFHIVVNSHVNSVILT